MSKRNKIIYWVSTLWLSLGMVSTGIVQLIQKQSEIDFITSLGYPAYLLIIIGIWKILGVVVVLTPKLPLLKEWAYAGFFFVMSGAIISHIAVNNGIKEIAPALLLLVLTIVSWLFRPADRKLVIA
ncbi:MAG TPA: DoxX family protein [Chitinophagales bacterium]|nr:DoxX family protein [Chitinophagales bacterium]HRG86221.1 DoxX family protein [Chitinophagales bacterium]HRH52375.1 DoxX family protein [Chitinophagales bacterium]